MNRILSAILFAPLSIFYLLYLYLLFFFAPFVFVGLRAYRWYKAHGSAALTPTTKSL